MNEERFSHHEACPRCGSRDNLGVWEDGHKFCFGCKYYVPSPDTIENLKRRTRMENNNNNDSVGIDTSGFTGLIPVRALTWLKKYGISDAEIQHYGIVWNGKTDSLVFPIRQGEKIIVTNERYFGGDPKHPKYLTYGHKAAVPGWITNKNTPESLVMVEDFVSAMKVARFASSLPLFGSTISDITLKWAVGRFKKLRVWLDMDKAVESLKQASRASQFLEDTRSIITELDPKEYDNQFIIKTLDKYNII